MLRAPYHHLSLGTYDLWVHRFIIMERVSCYLVRRSAPGVRRSIARVVCEWVNKT